jgi:addiction module HigA family antidote
MPAESRPDWPQFDKFAISVLQHASVSTLALPCVSEIVREKRSISPEMAVLLSAYSGTSNGDWIRLQAHFDLGMATDKVGTQGPHPRGADGRLQRV